jgi:hypothetical protein
MPFCDKLDKDRNGHVQIQDLGTLISDFITEYDRRHELRLSGEEKSELHNKIEDEMDFDSCGTIDQLQLKVFLTRKYD